MRIKKFEGSTLQEALSKVKKDFGPEAVILHTKKYKKGGVFGVFGKEMTEVTAGVDINVGRSAPPEPQSASFKAQTEKNETAAGSAAGPDFLQRPYAPQRPAGLSENKSHSRRIEDITMRSENFARELNEGKITAASGSRGGRETQGAKSAGASMKDGMGRIQKMLVDNGVEAELVFRMLQTMNSRLSDAQINNRQYADRFLYDYIADMVQVSGPIKHSPGNVKVISFIGPTGVGKTTTIAKLAAKYALLEGKKVVMASADTYRIAAETQLNKYGEIMGIPVEIVLTASDFHKIINKHSDKDFIFFDTAGRSPRNKKHLSDLKEFLEVYSPMENHLVISAVTKYYDALSIINNFGMVPVHRLLFTKLDETKNYGTLLNLSVGSGGIPISYLSIGQNVPDDIDIADPKVISRLVLKGDFESWIRQKN
ncbi:MAG: flagellar biosynthesis protein FlhF [Candidatus Goldiibacteriota bacterium]